MPPLLQQAIAAHQSGDRAGAMALYAQVLAAEPDQIDALTLLGTLHVESGDAALAVGLLARAVARDPGYANAWHQYGLALARQKEWAPAEAALASAIGLSPAPHALWLDLARLYTAQGKGADATAIIDELARDGATLPLLQLQAMLADQAGDHDRAANLAIRAGLAAGGDTAADPWLDLAQGFLLHAHYELALAVLDRAVAVAPASVMAAWLHTFTLALPIYRSQSQIDDCLAAFTARARALLEKLQALPTEALRPCEALVGAAHGLFLAYNGENVCAAQSAAGDVISQVMQRLYPVAPQPPLPAADGRIRLAIVSETFYYHSNMKLRRSWLRRIDRTKFRLCLYHVGDKVDFYTGQIRALCDEFHHFPRDFAGVLAQLQQDRPAIIQYTNLGLNPLTLKLAALRLAPLQATTWGHPITSGLATVDTYLSSDLMEPADAPAHYREKLVCLPGLSVVPEEIFAGADFQDFARADFGLGDSDIVYLCLQSVQKYLPEDDGIYAAIAGRVPRAKFVFIDAEAPVMAATFRRRLAATFAARGLDAAQFLVFLPTQDQPHYRALHRLADITLDSLGWSGANTSFEALELGGLLLTCPGRFMRGRHTSAILAFMELPQLIAADKNGYIDKAIAWGHDPAQRTQLRQDIAAAKPKLYRDPGLGDALNSFYAGGL